MTPVNHWEVDRVMDKDAGRDQYGLLATDRGLHGPAAIWDLSVSDRTEYAVQVTLWIFIAQRTSSENGFPPDREVSAHQTALRENEHLTQESRIENK